MRQWPWLHTLQLPLWYRCIARGCDSALSGRRTTAGNFSWHVKLFRSSGLKPSHRAYSGYSALVLLTALLCTGGVYMQAQVSTASILGHVADASGAIIPAATVTIRNVEQGTERTTTTDNAGFYQVLSLPVGPYEVKAAKAGLSTAIQTGINLVVGQQAVVNLSLGVGSLEQSVEVTTDTPLVNTTTAQVSGLIGEKEIKDLPLNGRSYDNLITLNPSAINFTSQTTYGFSGVGSSFVVAGRRQWENLFLLNGIEYTGASIISITPGGVSGELLGIDGIREFNVISGTYAAEYGKRSGAQVSIVTQSGTNDLHGTLFEFLRNSALDARNYFDHPVGRRIPPFQRNQYGAALGGPIKKNKTFIFGNFEGFNQRLGLSLLTVVPDNNARQGIIPINGVETLVPNLVPGMLPFLQNLWPAPNGANLGGGLAQTFSNPKQVINEYFGTVRVDQIIGQKDSLSGVYTIDSGTSATPLQDPVFAQDLYLRNQVFSLQEVHTFSPSVINTFTLGMSRAAFTYNNLPTVSLPADLSFIAGGNPGSIAIGGSQTIGSNTLTNSVPANPVGYVDRTLYTFEDGVGIVRGRHQISIGGVIQWILSNERTTSRSLGQSTSTNLESFLQGFASSFNIAPNQIPQDWRSLEGGWYLQDTYRATPRLTITAGLRVEYDNGWSENNGKGSIYEFGPNGILETTPVLVSQIYPWNNANNLLGPRVGLAYDMFGDGRTVLRAGFGVHYNLVDSSIAAGSTNNNPPYNGAAAYSNVQILSLIPFQPGVPLPPSCGPGVPKPCTTYSPRGNYDHLQTPTVESWNLTIEHQITPSTVLRLGYLGSFAYHQLTNVDANSVEPVICTSASGCTSGGVSSGRGHVPLGALYLPVTTRPNPYLSTAILTFFNGIANYNGLTVDLERRLAQGLAFRVNYTWSKNLDLGSGIGGSLALDTPQSVENPYDLGWDYGRSPLNLTHEVNGVLTYQLPFGRNAKWLGSVTGVVDKLVSGWQAGMIVTAHSGFDLTPQIGSNWSGNGDTSVAPDRPSYNPSFTGNLITGTQKQWFNPNAFSLPIPGTWGNVGRGYVIGPAQSLVNVSALKTTNLSERVALQFRAEFFNVLNHTNFGNPILSVFSGNTISPTAGLITYTSTTSRQIQFGLKVLF